MKPKRGIPPIFPDANDSRDPKVQEVSLLLSRIGLYADPGQTISVKINGKSLDLIIEPVPTPEP